MDEVDGVGVVEVEVVQEVDKVEVAGGGRWSQSGRYRVERGRGRWMEVEGGGWKEFPPSDAFNIHICLILII